MAQQATWSTSRHEDSLFRAFVFALLLHVVLLLFVAIGFSWSWQKTPAQESVIKARAVSLPAETVSKTAVDTKPVKKTAKPRPVAKPKPKKKTEKTGKPKTSKAEKQRRQKEMEQQMQQMLAEEEGEMARQASARKANEITDKFRTVIQQKVSRNWIKPAGVGKGLECVMRVRLAAGGDVISTEVVRSSGDAIFDRSVESAVFKAAPLPVPEDATMFERFREIEFLFRPET
ncbi:MAG: cell envelope integrity protein TolA [Gammaproteobacteria bacterium]|nr:cell envelope integrity protein TolA [Gammaproteobacteria bacterium]